MSGEWFFKHSRFAYGAIVLAAIALFPIFASANWVGHFTNMAIYAIGALGMVILFGWAGGLSLGQGAFFGFGAYTSALLTQAGVSPFLSLLAGIALSMMIALAISPILRLKRFYFAVATSAFTLIVFTVATGSEFTGASTGISVSYFSIGGFVFDSELKIFYLVWGLLLTFLLLTQNLGRSRFGRTLRSIRSSEETSASLGINVVRYKIIAFLISVALAAISGSLQAHYIRVANARMSSAASALQILFAVCIGGPSVPAGAVFGAGFLQLLPEVLRGAEKYQLLIYGLMFTLTVIYMPQGIAGLIETQLRKLRRVNGEVGHA